MKKVTKLLMVATVAAIGLGSFGACSDSVTVIEPPPPPPPEVDKAEVTIQGLRLIPGPGTANPNALAGDINVVLNVTQGDFNVTGVSLVLDGNPLGCQDVNASQAPSGDGVAANVAAQADEVECFLDTDAVVGECVGEQVAPRFSNGEHVLGARITLSDGTTVNAENTITVNFTNSDFVLVTHLEGGQGLVGTNGRRYWGGEDVSFAACPVSYAGTEVGTIELAGTADPAGDADGDAVADLSVDFGSGAGAVHSVSTSPFVFTAGAAANDGVEDDPAAGRIGHTIGATGNVFAADGENVSTAFTFMPVTLFWMDFTGPTIGAAPEIFIDGASVLATELYSAGAFTLGDVSDAGVGMDQSTITMDANDASDGSTAFEDVSEVPDLTEDDGTLDADANGFDAYELEVLEIADFLGNTTDPAGLGAANPSAEFGVDMTEPDISGVAPTTAGIILNDTGLDFSAADPDLESGDPGSGVDALSVAAEDQDGNAVPVTDLGGGDFEVDITGLADGAWMVDVTVPDFAVLSPNVADVAYDFILDTTAPSVNVVNPPPGNVSSSASTVTMTFAGNASDENDLASLTLTVTEPGVDGICGNADDTAFPEGTDPGQVDQNTVEVDVSEGGTIEFSHNFLFQNTGDGSDQTACFNATGEDTALDRNEDPNPNTNIQTVRTEIDWQTP